MKSSTTKRVVTGLVAAAMPLFANAERAPTATTSVASDIVIKQPTTTLYAPILFGDKLNAYRIYRK